jgi:large subunit ribosomal protein L4
MQLAVYNQKGEEVDKINLPKEIFETEINNDLVHQVVLSQMANKRKPIAHTKDRGEVRGGGRKPWRQKGTGRARHGSIRSPIWRGGGVTFGPRNEKIFEKKIPKKMKKKALFMVLSSKAKDKEIIILDDLNINEPKTKIASEIFKNLSSDKKTKLLALPFKNDNVLKAARNISKIKIILAKDLNVLDLLSYKYLIMPKESIKVIKETFLK